jgi:hypothetical protein
MSVAMRVETKTDTDGRLDYLTVYRKGRKAVHLHFVYGHDGFLSDIEFTGKKEDMPDIPTIVELINEKFMERIGTIKIINDVELLELIEEITSIKKIEVISNMPDPTPKGSAGVAFQQTAPTAGDVGAWMSPTGHEAGSGWGLEVQAYDDNLATGAEIFVESIGWSAFLVLTIAAVASNKLRFQAQQNDYTQSLIDVDVYKDGAWVDVYEGTYNTDDMIEKPFAQGSVTKARVRFYAASINCWMMFYEFDFWKVASAGGTGGVMKVQGADVSTTPTLYNVTMTLANTEYSQALPANTKRFSIKTRDGTAFRIAFVTGKVAAPTDPYETVPANWEYYEDTLLLAASTLFFGCAGAGKIVEITVWT